MSWKRRWTLCWRWSLLSAALIALFWAIWWRVTGSVPVVTSIKLSEDWIWQLPFGVSRWWDILMGPIWATTIVLIFTRKMTDDFIAGLIAGLTVGLIVGLSAGLSAGLIAGLGAGLIAGLGAGLIAGLGAGLIAGLIAGLTAGLIAGLTVGLIAGLTVGLIAGLGAGLRYLFSRSFWEGVGRWLAAKDV